MMKKEFVFNWEIFKNKGFEFQDLCADIFKHYNYDVRVMEQGGDDRGRDIEVYKQSPINLLDSSEKELLAWVECKSSMNSTISLSDVRVNFVYAVKEKITYLIFITNNKFTNPAHNLFGSYNKDPDITIKTRTIEKDELELILKSAPDVYLKYFDKNATKDDYVTIDSHPTILSSIDVNSKFVGEFEGYRIKLKSIAFVDSKLLLTSPDNSSQEIYLSPLEEKEIFIPTNKHVLNSTPKLSAKDSSLIIQKRTNIPESLHYKIDHVFIDPNGLKEFIVNQLQYNNHIYITGNAGKGKTRLIKEVCRSLQKKVTNIDLSEDYEKSFLDHLLMKLLGTEREYLALLPEESITNYLADKNLDEQVIPVVFSYIKGKSEVNYDVITSLTSGLFLEMFKNEVVVIDNIHNFSFLDFKLFKAILDINKSTEIICTARSNEIDNRNLSLYLNNLQETNSISIVDLQSQDTGALLKVFVENVSESIDTIRFLKKFSNVPGIQQFVIILKNLRARNVLFQTEEGKLGVNTSNYIGNTDYLAAYKDLIATIQYKINDTSIDFILKTAATYGYRFPIDLFNSDLDNTALLDELLLNEILVVDQESFTHLRFDHEITREIIYAAIPHIQRISLHKNIIRYLESLDQTNLGFCYRQLFNHYEAIGAFGKSAFYANKEGHNLLQKSEIADAYDFFEKALERIKRYNEDSSQEMYELEANTLENLIKLNFQLGRNVNTYNQIRALHVLTHLIRNDYYEGVVYYHFAKYYFDNLDDIDTALGYIDKAIHYFELKDANEYGKSLNFKGVISKNIGEYSQALELHTKAIDIYTESNNYEGLSESLADIGAVYLESGKGDQTVKWWEKSLQTIKKTSNVLKICERLIDYSYIMALYSPDTIHTKGELENALFMSKRLFSFPNICRAEINYANYLFRINEKEEYIKVHIENAIEIATKNDLEYLQLLAKFSFLNFQQRNADTFVSNYTEWIIEYLIESYCKSFLIRSVSDNRVINMFKYFIASGNSKLLQALNIDQSNSLLNDFDKNMKHHSITELEKENPYFFNSTYLTYY